MTSVHVPSDSRGTDDERRREHEAEADRLLAEISDAEWTALADAAVGILLSAERRRQQQAADEAAR